MSDPEQPAPFGDESRPTNESVSRSVPLIWVASLTDYNNGRLVGQWIDAARSADAVASDISMMLATSASPGAEEWAIFDYEGFGPLRIGEYESLERVTAVARSTVEKGPAFAHLASLIGIAEALEQFDDVYVGHHDSFHEYVEELIDELGYRELIEASVPRALQAYVLFDAYEFADDLWTSGSYLTSEGDEGVYIFDLRMQERCSQSERSTDHFQPTSPERSSRSSPSDLRLRRPILSDLLFRASECASISTC